MPILTDASVLAGALSYLRSIGAHPCVPGSQMVKILNSNPSTIDCLCVFTLDAGPPEFFPNDLPDPYNKIPIYFPQPDNLASWDIISNFYSYFIYVTVHYDLTRSYSSQIFTKKNQPDHNWTFFRTPVP